MHRDGVPRLARGRDDGSVYLGSAAGNRLSLVGYRFERPAIFVPLDRGNDRAFGLDDAELPLGDNAPFQALSLALFERFGDVVHGLSWRSMHRNQPGRVYALWHHHKATIALATVPADRQYPSLLESAEWAEVLQNNPRVDRLDPAAC